MDDEVRDCFLITAFFKSRIRPGHARDLIARYLDRIDWSDVMIALLLK